VTRLLLLYLQVRSVSCPGVHLSVKDDVYLNMFFMDQFRQSLCVPAVFPLLFHEEITFEKIFRHAVDPGEIAVLLESGDTLAFFEEDARSFLFPEPKLVPSFSGVDREVLMTRAAHFFSIAPRLEFSTKTTISEYLFSSLLCTFPRFLCLTLFLSVSPQSFLLSPYCNQFASLLGPLFQHSASEYLSSLLGPSIVTPFCSPLCLIVVSGLCSIRLHFALDSDFLWDFCKLLFIIFSLNTFSLSIPLLCHSVFGS
uniref:Spermatogenesis-associated protein 6 N-terminal domain-containing protein n=1 Tax=Poecilia mexicana TaxID=48701 RepID=A0A3B3XTI4_9TELE